MKPAIAPPIPLSPGIAIAGPTSATASVPSCIGSHGGLIDAIGEGVRPSGARQPQQLIAMSARAVPSALAFNKCDGLRIDRAI
jgi:hypothetical protein